MTIEAHVQNGQIVLSSPLQLPDGTKVEVSVPNSSETTSTENSRGQSINERLKEFIGKAEGLPEDFAENHDHYLHGTAKKSDS